ncbi:MAG: transglutaminase family protein [Promethearchaeota archaeon]
MKRFFLLFVFLFTLIPPVFAESYFVSYSVTTYDLSYVVTVQNLGPSDAIDIPLRVALLKTWEPHQIVHSISITPEPSEKYTDFLNNSFVMYHIDSLAPEEEFEVRIYAIIEVYGIDYSIEPKLVGAYDVDDFNYKTFIEPSKLIESDDPQIQAEARNILNDSNTLLDTIFKTYNWIIDNIEYEKVPGEIGALYAYKNREGDSAEFGNLFTALLRANNIPSRRISGWGGTLDEGNNYTTRQVAHGWAEFYLPNYGWIPSDPTFGRLHRWDNFAKADDKHIILTKGSDIHFFTRGQYSEPFGTTEVLTDYNIIIHKKNVNFISNERNAVLTTFFVIPIVFLFWANVFVRG